MSLWCGTKQLSQDLRKTVVLVWFSSFAVRTQPTQPAEQTALIFSGHQKIPWLKWPAWFCIFMYIVVFPQSCFFTVCVVSNIWEMCSSAKMSMQNFTSSLHQVKQQLILLLLWSWSDPTVQITTSLHEAVTPEPEKSPAKTKHQQGKFANWVGTNHLCRNKAKRSRCESTLHILFYISVTPPLMNMEDTTLEQRWYWYHGWPYRTTVTTHSTCMFELNHSLCSCLSWNTEPLNVVTLTRAWVKKEQQR